MIIIIGDSWGVGEWGLDNNEYCLTGPGIGQYLSLHNTVVNLSAGASTNTESIDRLERFLEKYLFDSNDTVYWIVTDPLRCKKITSFDTTVSIESEIRNTLSLCLTRANNLAKKHFTTINLIGGLCDLETVNISLYKNLKISVASWGKLIDPNYHSSLYCGDHWESITQSINTRDKKQEFLDITKLIELKEDSMRKIFIKDGNHPDRNGHRILRDYLYPEWKHKF